ncbi:MAG: hypothetical protein MUO50_04840, partial [Longimicrobiales bacterium]|nr:hypothetical protein [Longimicrobiales bacterium]
VFGSATKQVSSGCREPKEDASEADTGGSKRVIMSTLRTISVGDIISHERCPAKDVPGHLRIATFHGPHPSQVTGKATLEDVRQFFENAGIKP